MAKRRKKRVEDPRDPTVRERWFARARLATATTLAPGNVLRYEGPEHVLVGMLGVVVARPATIVSPDGVTPEPYVRKFILFENGIRRTLMHDLLDDVVLAGRIPPEAALDHDSGIKDPWIPRRHNPKLFILEAW